MSFIDLCTVSQVENWLGQTAGTDAALIALTITNFSRYVLTRTGRPYLGGFQTYSERYNGNGSTRLQVRNYPILAVTSLQVGLQVIPQSADFIQAGWVIDTSGSQCAIGIVGGGCNGWIGNGSTGQSPWNGNGNAPPLGQSPYRFWEGLQNVAATYTAGFVTEAMSESQTVGATPYTVTVVNSATFYQDMGVTLANGTSLAGQYTVSKGVYTFSAAQSGVQVLISYQYGAVPEDLNQMATSIVATNYRSRKWIDQVSQMQPGVGTTSFLQKEMRPIDTAIIERYTRRFLDS